MKTRKVIYIILLILFELIKPSDAYALGSAEATPPGMVTISQEEYRSLVEDHVKLLRYEEAFAEVDIESMAVNEEGEIVEEEPVEKKRGRLSIGGGVLADTKFKLGYFGLAEVRVTDHIGVVGQVMYADKFRGGIGLKINPK